MARPGQDLLAQSRSGADVAEWRRGPGAGAVRPGGRRHAGGRRGAQGILAGLVRRGVTGKGSHVETSLLEALVDFQFEVLTTHLNDGRRPPKRSNFRSAHAYLSAPYGVYQASDGYLAIAMTPIGKLADLLATRRARALSRRAVELVHGARRDQEDHRGAHRHRKPSTSGWQSSSRPTSGAPRCCRGTR